MEQTKKKIIIEAMSLARLSFLADKIWYNPFEGMTAEQKTKTESLYKTLDKGDEIELYLGGTLYWDINLVKKGEGEKKSWADDMTNLKTLLDTAHKKGLVSITTEMISVDWEKKNALFKARVLMINGKDITKQKSFEGYGDSTQENIDSDKVKLSWIRMAESRAIVRALRWATNNASVAEEELDTGNHEEESVETKEIKQDTLVQTNEEIEEAKQ